MKQESKKKLKKIIITFFIIILAAVLCFAGINTLVILKTKTNIVEVSDTADINADCIIVLGCRAYSNGNLSPMLEDRVETGINILKAGGSDRLLMSGDHGQKEYDEVNAMKAYSVKKGIDPDIIFLDHAGFSTYESMYRLRDIFGAKKVIIVTQKYHLYRAIYIAESLGLEAYGVSADIEDYGESTNQYNSVRESTARVKDFFTCIFKPKPTYLGETISLDGSAKQTDDKTY